MVIGLSTIWYKEEDRRKTITNAYFVSTIGMGNYHTSCEAPTPP